ncbi:hypothetical protein SESBI_21538 [Sesbania bispinosa]|nr:hypothetical protein SESBI_21538 [Sesbania bispinosa]
MSSVSASPSSSSRWIDGDGVGWTDGIGCCEEMADKSFHPGVGIIVNAKREGWSGGHVGWTDGGEGWTDGGGEGWTDGGEGWTEGGGEGWIDGGGEGCTSGGVGWIGSVGWTGGGVGWTGGGEGWTSGIGWRRLRLLYAARWPGLMIFPRPRVGGNLLVRPRETIC